jgi:glutaminyl-tRNA synthetase
MRFSFSVAKNNGGKCYLRYDDTNPDKETKEYITNIEENVKWLGYEPWKITFASDLFDTLYQFAIVLIKKGKAYVCHQTKADVKEFRKNMIDSPYRNRSVEENLYLFEKMRQGRFAEKEVKRY